MNTNEIDPSILIAVFCASLILWLGHQCGVCGVIASVSQLFFTMVTR